MNGIVHPCTHPEGKPAPKTEGEMMLEVFKYTERVVAMIKPRKLLFMAIGAFARSVRPLPHCVTARTARICISRH